MRRTLWLGAVLVFAAGLARAGTLTPELRATLGQAAPGEKVSCLVYMKQAYPYEALAGQTVVERIHAFQRIAKGSQRPVLSYLRALPMTEAEVKQCFWVMNGFHLMATQRVIRELALREDVAWIAHDGEVHLIAEPSYQTAPPGITAAEWNILKVVADSCWAAGYNGQGIIIGQTDTGVEYTHPALQGKWSGYWHVSQGLPPSATPYDDHGHGTHITGTICGGDGPGPFADDIGVAYNARFAAAKVLNSGGSGTYAQCIEGLQFMADLKDSVDVKAVSSSWGSTATTDTQMMPVCRMLKAVGILPVFANGNSGPNPGTAGVPGNYPVTLGVGATDNADAIASFSSRGPAPNQAPWNDPANWWRSDWNLIKPQISAPGVSVRSCIPGGGYQSWNGTSMATPHVAGAVAILSQKNHNLSPTALYNLLLDNVDQPSGGGPYPNNNYGWGRLNVWKALQSTPMSNVPYVVIASRQLTDPPPGGNGNGLWEPGETAQLVAMLSNIGADARNVKGILKSQDNFVTVGDDSSFFGNIPRNGQASNSSDPYLLTAHPLTPPGHPAELELILSAQGDSGNFCDTTRFTVVIGTPPPPYVIWEDDFEYGGGQDSLLSYWNVSANWARSNAKSHSAPWSLYNGNVKGTYEVRLRNGVDLRPFADPRVGFWQTHNFDNLWVEAYAEVSTNGGANWAELWRYDWINDPDSIPWIERIHSLAAYKSQNVQVRFRVNINNLSGFQRWFVDDFKLFAARDNEPPYFTNTIRWRDTTYLGPFPVSSKVTDASGVDSAYLYYRVNSGSWQRLVMAPQGGDIYQASIPAQSLDDRIDYYLWARDRWVSPNSGTDPVGAPGSAVYSFRLSPSGVESGPLVGDRVYFLPIRPNPTRGPVDIAFGLPRETGVRLCVYDLTGRRVRTLVEQPLRSGEYRMRWDRKDDRSRAITSGVYFVKFEAGEYRRLVKLVLIK